MSGRESQRRRTRTAILDATIRLVEAGATPSIDEIAAEAQVSRRTIYMYFPTLDQLLIDATVGALSSAVVDAALDRIAPAEDAVASVDALVRALLATAPSTLPLGRKLIALTSDFDSADAERPTRGFRRISWIENALDPARAQLSMAQFERLVSALTVIIGWEAMIVLRDLRGLDDLQEQETLRWAATRLVQAALAESSAPEQS